VTQPTGPINAAEYLATHLEAGGVTAVFFVPTILSRTLYELEAKTGVQRILTHGEKATVYMADGYARACGRPGVCLAQNVGAANLAAGLRDPFLASSPVLAMTGGPFEYSRGRSYYQEIEDFPLYKSVTKFSAQVENAGRLPDLLDHALAVATSGRPGPVHLELDGHSAEPIETGIVNPPESDGRVWQVPRFRMQADPESVAEAARLLAQAERPAIVAGGGARSSGAGPELLALAEKLNVPVATSLNGKDVFPGNHPLNVGVPGLYARGSANQVLLEADLVFYIGSKTGSQVTFTWQVPPLSTKVIQLEIEPSEIGRHYPDTLGIAADARLGLRQLLAAVDTAGTGSGREAWVARASQLGERWRNEQRPQLTSEQSPIRPERLCAELTEHLPGDAILMSDTGHSGMWTGAFVDLLHPSQSFLRAAGSLGWGLPAALGAQVGAPDRPVVLFTGDGGLWYHLSELETAARRNIPATIVVNNNKALNQEFGVYTNAYGGELHGRHAELWHFRDTNFAELAESMGVLGLRVEKPGELSSALAQAVESDRPALIDVVADIEAMAPRASATPAPR
jgi:acetolactate synthase I/II/III large subunit